MKLSNKKDLIDFLIMFGDEYSLKQHANGSFPSGHNGPYYDEESSVRNTAHAIVLFSKLYELTNGPQYRIIIINAISYLLEPNCRPGGYTFFCRTKKGKDSCNGLVGQAWVIEAFIAAYKALNDEELYRHAEEVFFLHQFNDDVGLWHRRDINGDKLSFDPTFNHQLWFAATASMLRKTPEAIRQSEIFLERTLPALELYSDGTLKHNTPMGYVCNYLSLGGVSFIRELKRRFVNSLKDGKFYSKSVGYHGFNLYAFALLKENLAGDSLFNLNSPLLTKMFECLTKEGFRTALEKSIFGYKYNVSGFEFAYSLILLRGAGQEEAFFWINRQFDSTYLDNLNPIGKQVPDQNTAMARVYEVSRIVEHLS